MPIIRASLLAVLALIGLALALDPARAQDPPETTTLHPGVNLVVWTAELTPAVLLFHQIPQLEAIWAWDAVLGNWKVAARDAPELLGGLGLLTPGMGLRMQLGGDEPFVWQRSTEPTRGLVKLRAGWNLVAWSGADQTPIDDALKGIGWSLRNVHRWNPVTQQWNTWISPERTAQLIAADNTDQETNDDTEMPTIRRGEALWINVARAVNWLQPTDILPRLVFPGGASQHLQTRVHEDLEAVLAFYRDQYGIQADPDFTIYIAGDVDALLQAYKDDGQYVDDAFEASTRARWNRVAGWAGGDIVVRSDLWPESPLIQITTHLPNGGSYTNAGRYTITHEYFHILQFQLSDGWASQWLVEGTADWVDDEHKVFDGELTWGDLRDVRLSQITDAQAPTLRSTERENARWHYHLGWLATDRLIADGGPDSLIEFWHRLASTEIGPHGRWTSTPDWRTALQQVSGQTVSEFYTDFAAWQREQAAANVGSPSSYEYDGNWIRGKVVFAGDAAVPGVFVNAVKVESGTSVGWNQRAETAADGSFAVRAPEAGDYILSVDINDDCHRHYRNGTLVEEWSDASLINVAGVDVAGIDIRWSPDVCGWHGEYIRGRVVGPNAEPLVGVRVSLRAQVDRYAFRTFLPKLTAHDGSFALPAEAGPGIYTLTLVLTELGAEEGGCSLFYETEIEIVNEDIHVGLLRVPEGACAYKISGRLIDSSGTPPLWQTMIWAQAFGAGSPDGVWTYRGADADGVWTAPSGHFEIRVPSDGAYRLHFSLDDCTVYIGRDGLTSNIEDAQLFRVDGRDIQLSPLQVSAGVYQISGCGYQISGTIIGSDGTPLDTWVTACEQADTECATDSSVKFDSDGSFAITVPVSGAYRLEFDLPDCTVYIGGDDLLTSNIGDAQLLRMDGWDIRLLSLQVPAGVCGYQISGTIVGSDGAALDTWVTACEQTDTECATGSSVEFDSDGSFAITVPVSGAYRLEFDLPDCTVYIGRDGLTSNIEDAQLFLVDGRNIRISPRQVSARLCGYQITGRIIGADSQPLADSGVVICHEVDGWCHGPDWTEPAWTWTDGDGEFAITVPTEGRHRVLFNCGGVISYLDGVDVHVSGADVTDIILRLPVTIEELCE